MRRLTEILAFPKAWYRRSIVRRLFLGDLSSGAAYSEGDGSPSLNQEEAVMGSSLLKHYDRHACDSLSKSAPERSPILNREKLKLTLENDIPRPARLKGICFRVFAQLLKVNLKLTSNVNFTHQILGEAGVLLQTNKCHPKLN